MTRFGSLYYTDCRPGQGLQGGAGFQFQAATPGLAAESMPLVQRCALYEPPAIWMREGRPVPEYPGSLAHTQQGEVFVTSAGRYLGQEANGLRHGNQFTHAIVTSSPAAYGGTRPAQLWQARWWASAPAPGTELPELPAGLTPGPLDTETVRDRVRDSVDGPDCLIALLSAAQQLVDPARRRTVVLVSSDPELAACWIAAATLLMPRPAALGVSFKIFVADPRYGQHDIIAVHPDWAGHWADTGAGSGLAVFDLDLGRHSRVEPTESAQFWVPRFFEHDAYDVVDAIELAGQFGGADSEGGRPADRLVALTVATGQQLSTPEQLTAVADWLLCAPEQAVGIAADAVLDAVFEARPSAGVLRTLAAAVARRGWVEAEARIQAELLGAEIAELLAAGDGVSALLCVTALPALRWSSPRPAGLRERIEAALREAGVDRVPALLSVAARYGVTARSGMFAETAAEFARWWLEQPHPELAPARWPAPVEALDWVRDVLRDWLAGPGNRRAHDAIARGWWSVLLPEAREPDDPLDALVIATAVARLPEPARRRLIGQVQDWSVVPSTVVPSTVAWLALFGDSLPPSPHAEEFLRGLRDRKAELTEYVAGRLMAVAESEDGSVPALRIARELARQGRVLSSTVVTLLESDDVVRQIVQDLTAPNPRHSAADIASALAQVPPGLLRIHAPDVVEAMVTALNKRAFEVLRRCGHQTSVPLYAALEQGWPAADRRPTGPQCRRVAFTFLLVTGKSTTSGEVNAARARELAALADRFAARVWSLSKSDRAAIESGYQVELGKRWREWVAEQRPARWRGVLGLGERRPAGRPGSEE